jgi:epoxyqueuosine reductase
MAGVAEAAGRDAHAIKAEIAAEAQRLGFDAVGFASAEQPTGIAEDFDAFVAEGRHGGMDWMAGTAERRRDPRALWPGARSIVALGMSYAPRDDPMAALARRDRGAVSVYARGADYHKTLKSRIKRLARFMHARYGSEVKVFVDTAPVMEKPAAMRAGLGWQGKHTNLVSREHGSWLFLGEIFSALALPPDTPGEDHCGTCRDCIEVCPTAAITAPYRLDARRCISYLTIEHKGHIAREFRAAIGNRIYGCDDCLAVCPWNKFAQAAREAAFLPRAELTAPRLADLAGLDDGAFRGVFAGSTIKRIGRDRFLRNVLIALGNSGDAALAPVCERLLDDDSPLVRAMAVWALSRLVDKRRFLSFAERRMAGETDPDVRAEWEAGARNEPRRHRGTEESREP